MDRCNSYYIWNSNPIRQKNTVVGVIPKMLFQNFVVHILLRRRPSQIERLICHLSVCSVENPNVYQDPSQIHSQVDFWHTWVQGDWPFDWDMNSTIEVITIAEIEWHIKDFFGHSSCIFSPTERYTCPSACSCIELQFRKPPRLAGSRNQSSLEACDVTGEKSARIDRFEPIASRLPVGLEDERWDFASNGVRPSLCLQWHGGEGSLHSILQQAQILRRRTPRWVDFCPMCLLSHNVLLTSMKSSFLIVLPSKDDIFYLILLLTDFPRGTVLLAVQQGSAFSNCLFLLTPNEVDFRVFPISWWISRSINCKAKRAA